MMRYYWGPRRWRVRPEYFDGGRRIPVEVQSDDESYIVRALVPGKTADELQIEVLEDLVTLKTLSAEDGAVESQGEMLLSEIDRAGGSYRRIRLPEPVDAEQVKANLENGLLTVWLPKSDAKRTKRIEVSTK